MFHFRFAVVDRPIYALGRIIIEFSFLLLLLPILRTVCKLIMSGGKYIAWNG